MDYKILRQNKNLVKGFLKGRITAMEKEGLQRDKIITFYKDLLEEMRQPELELKPEIELKPELFENSEVK